MIGRQTFVGQKSNVVTGRWIVGTLEDGGGFVDQLQIARLKKRKLQLKDRIAIIEDTLLPDIIA